jgi:hypothetical protein
LIALCVAPVNEKGEDVTGWDGKFSQDVACLCTGQHLNMVARLRIMVLGQVLAIASQEADSDLHDVLCRDNRP